MQELLLKLKDDDEKSLITQSTSIICPYVIILVRRSACGWK